MRHLYVLIMVLVSFGANSQVYNGQNFPAIGEKYPLHTVVPGTVPLSQMMDAGPWYFPQLPADYIDTIYFASPASTGFSTDFPSASIALIDTGISDFPRTTFLSNVNGDLMSEGQLFYIDASNQIAFPLQEPLIWLDLPVQLGASMNDTGMAEFFATGAEVGMPADSIQNVRTIIRSDTVDAVSSISLPGLVVDDAIRRIRTDLIIDSLFTKTGGTWSYDQNFSEPPSTEGSIEWYHADEDWLIAQAFTRNGELQFIRYAEGSPPTIRLEFSGLPASTYVLDTIESFQVSAYNISTGDLVTSFQDTIRIKAIPDTGLYGWEMTELSVVPVGGVATFTDLFFVEPGQHQLLAYSDTVAADTAFVSIPAPTVRIEFSPLPTDISTLDTIPSVQVTAYNISTGTVASGFTNSITIDAYHVLGNDSIDMHIEEATVTPVSGVATFNNLAIKPAGQYVLTAWSVTVFPDTSNIINVHPTASYLEASTGSYTLYENQQLQTISVLAMTDSGHVDSLYYQGDVRVGKLSGPGELLGTKTQTLVNGVATFNDLRLTHQGDYELLFYSPVDFRYLPQDTLSLSVNPNPGTWNTHYTDTITKYVDRANEFYWTGGLHGFSSGTSRGYHFEIGQHFDFHGQARITKMLIHFATRMHVGDDTDTFQLKIYDAGLYTGFLESNYFGDRTVFMDSLPIKLLGSQYFAADSMQFGDYWQRNPTTIEFDDPPLVNSSFIVSLVTDSELSNDTIIVWINIPGDGQQEYRTSTWTRTFSSPEYPDTLWLRDKYHNPFYDVDLMIEPVLEVDTLSTIVAIDELTEKVEMNIHPNPFTDYLTVELSGKDAGYLVEIYSVRGKVLYSRRVDSQAKTKLDIGFLASGVYGLVVWDANGTKRNAVKILKAE